MKRRGFTLVEILVVIGVIGVLIGITAPVIRGARSRAYEAVDLSNLRGIGQTVEMYAGANRDKYPFLATDDEAHWLEYSGGMWTSDPWAMRYAWPITMHHVAPWDEYYASWISPFDAVRQEHGRPWEGAGDDSMTVWPSYRYCNSFVARPVVWSGVEASALDDTVFAPTMTTEVANPSGKALMFNLFEKGVSRSVLGADGAAAMRADADARPPAINPLWGGEPRIYHDTANGVLGTDF